MPKILLPVLQAAICAGFAGESSTLAFRRFLIAFSEPEACCFHLSIVSELFGFLCPEFAARPMVMEDRSSMVESLQVNIQCWSMAAVGKVLTNSFDG
jgi:hypothetical protein